MVLSKGTTHQKMIMNVNFRKDDFLSFYNASLLSIVLSAGLPKMKGNHLLMQYIAGTVRAICSIVTKKANSGPDGFNFVPKTMYDIPFIMNNVIPEKPISMIVLRPT